MRLVAVQGPLSVVPGTSKVALAGLTGDVLNAGTVEGQSALTVAGQGLRRRSSLVAYSPDTQVGLVTLATTVPFVFAAVEGLPCMLF